MHPEAYAFVRSHVARIAPAAWADVQVVHVVARGDIDASARWPHGGA